MADPVIVKRLAQKLQEAADATPKGEGFWPDLARLAAEEYAKVIVVTQQALPPKPFLAVVAQREGYRLVARGATLVELTAPATAFFDEGGSGELWVVEIKRVYVGS